MNDRHPMNLNPSTIFIAPDFRVRGGKETHTAPISDNTRGNARIGVSEVTTIVHDEQEYADAKAIVSQARHAVRSHSTHTIIGYLTDKSRIDDIKSDVARVKESADEFNARARTCQVVIYYLPIPISVALGAEAARHLADHVREELSALHTALRAGRIDGEDGARSVLLRTKNLHLLAVGVQSEAIVFSVEEGADRLRDLKAAIKAKESPESAGRHLDLGMIESGIATFSYDANASERQIDLSSLGS